MLAVDILETHGFCHFLAHQKHFQCIRVWNAFSFITVFNFQDFSLSILEILLKITVNFELLLQLLLHKLQTNWIFFVSNHQRCFFFVFYGLLELKWYMFEIIELNHALNSFNSTTIEKWSFFTLVHMSSHIMDYYISPMMGNLNVPTFQVCLKFYLFVTCSHIPTRWVTRFFTFELYN